MEEINGQINGEINAELIGQITSNSNKSCIFFIVCVIICLIVVSLLIFVFKSMRFPNETELEQSEKEASKEARIKLENIFIYLKKFWCSFIIYAVSTSIIILFIASIIFDKNITVNIINQWVGLILGLAALLIGIISLVISFYNVDQAFQSQEKTREMLRELRQDLSGDIKHSADHIITETNKATFSGEMKAAVLPKNSYNWEEQSD